MGGRLLIVTGGAPPAGMSPVSDHTMGTTDNAVCHSPFLMSAPSRRVPTLLRNVDIATI